MTCDDVSCDMNHVTGEIPRGRGNGVAGKVGEKHRNGLDITEVR